MSLNWFANILVHHPCIIIAAITTLSATCLIIPFTLKAKSFPDFSDPQLGFTTRGTTISNRLVAWENLVQATKPSGPFAMNPKDVIMAKLAKNTTTLKSSKNKKNERKRKKEKVFSTKVLIEENTNRTSNSNANNNWKTLKNLLTKNATIFNDRRPASSSGYFCGNPDEKYAHVVLKSDENVDLFTLNSLLTLCKIENNLIKLPYYRDLCIEKTKNGNKRSKCCKPWSLANYVAALHNRSSCLAITEEDVNATKTLLINCSPYFYNLQLTGDCSEKGYYCDAPLDCIRHEDVVFNVLNFLTSSTFLSPNNNNNNNNNYNNNSEIIDKEYETTTVLETIIFLPIACSVATLPYYHKLENININLNGISIVAMEFGIKNALFDEYLIKDTWLMGTGILFVFLCIWLYTKSLFLTIMTIIAIIFSLGISYFFYTFILKLKFFPFMNLLAIIVAIGIGSDDAFIFCKIWQTLKLEKNNSIVKLMRDTAHHAFLSIFVTTLTTSAAFLASLFSSITAVACFSIFSSVAVIVNFILMITWFPASVVIWERSCCSNVETLKNILMVFLKRWCCSNLIKPQWNFFKKWPKCLYLENLWNTKERILIDSVINLRYLWLVVLTIIAIISGIIVLYYPKLKLPDSTEFQMFKSSHPFEKYDFYYKNHFWFKKSERINIEQSSNYKLPLRFVWGILPIDNGDHLDPINYGKLKLDPNFDITNNESQVWLLKFCRELKKQPFYGENIGPILPNCFIETFIKSMERKCYDRITNINRIPCCEITKFPYNKTIFNKCIIDEMTDIYETPTQYLIPGIAGPKFSKDQFPTIKAIIIEYDSNYNYSISYKYMNKFFNIVEKWMLKQLKTAPKQMKNGWFISDLQFYDLQNELTYSTLIAIIMSMSLAFIVILLSTLNILISLYAIITITFSIFVTIAILIILGWKLNILESIAVSTAIGLTVDFTLHYSINYKIFPYPTLITDDRISATKFALTYMSGPSLMAAITTCLIGIFMLPSIILPYYKIGIFLIIVMCVSWLYSTFYLGSILSIIGPQNYFGQFYYKKLFFCYLFQNKNNNNKNQKQKSNNTNYNNILPIPSISDTHELEILNNKSSINNFNNKKTTLNRSLSGSCNKTSLNKYIFTDQSPSATSAITIIMADDN